MPQLHEILKSRDTKKFVKKSYRPWDLSGSSPIRSFDDEQNNISITNEQIALPSVDSKELSEQGTPLIAIPSQISLAAQVGTTVMIEKSTITLPNETNKSVQPIKDNTAYTDNNKVTIGYQLDNARVTDSNQLGNEKGTSEITNKQQLDNMLDATSKYNQVLSLSGLQRNILGFVTDICSVRDNLSTGPIETNTVCTYVKSTSGATKMSIKRLIDKGLLIRNKGRTAKGGYINLSIPREIFMVVIDQRKHYQRYTNPNDMVNYIRQQLDNNPVHSSSSNLNKNITTKKEVLSKEWDEINFESLSEIGFGKTQIKQLVDRADPAIVQESINHFAFGLYQNQKINKYDDPLNVLMGVLRKGQGWFEKNYRTQKEIAQQQLLENKKAELERKKNLEEEAYKLALIEWQQKLTSEESEKIAPSYKSGGDITPQPAKLSMYFREHIWSDKKNDYLI